MIGWISQDHSDSREGPGLLPENSGVKMRCWRNYRNRMLSACALIFGYLLLYNWQVLSQSDNITLAKPSFVSTNIPHEALVLGAVQNNKRTLMGADYNSKTKGTTPSDIVFVINNSDLCNRRRHLKYIVYFTTAPGNAMKRMLMRNTWAADNIISEGMIGRVFMVGQTVDRHIQEALEEENSEFKDIIQGDFIDSYRQLPLKGVMALKWVSEFCPQARYAIKADDDAFVNIFGLIHILEHYQDQPRAILGHCWGYGEKPTTRDHKSEWYLSEEEMPDEFFPDYCIGLLYVISQDIIPELYQASLTTPLVHIEDLYVTGLLASRIGNVQHIGFKKNFTFDMVGCKMISRDLKNRRGVINHVASECSEKNIPMLWKLYQQRTRQEVQLLTNAVIQSTCKLVVVEDKPKLKKSCR